MSLLELAERERQARHGVRFVFFQHCSPDVNQTAAMPASALSGRPAYLAGSFSAASTWPRKHLIAACENGVDRLKALERCHYVRAPDIPGARAQKGV
jgi:hypothetical protein